MCGASVHKFAIVAGFSGTVAVAGLPRPVAAAETPGDRERARAGKGWPGALLDPPFRGPYPGAARAASEPPLWGSERRSKVTRLEVLDVALLRSARTLAVLHPRATRAEVAPISREPAS
jgi:hypothetical protein